MSQMQKKIALPQVFEESLFLFLLKIDCLEKLAEEEDDETMEEKSEIIKFGK